MGPRDRLAIQHGFLSAYGPCDELVGDGRARNSNIVSWSWPGVDQHIRSAAPSQAVIVMAEVTKPPPPKARGTRRTLAHRRLVVRGCDTLQPIGSSYQGTS
jgi:hypothetical protein